MAFPSFQQGMRCGLPLALGVAAFGLVWGALAGQAGLGLAEVALMSGLVFAGAAQFVVLPFWSPTQVPPLGALIATTLVVNLRFMLMSASMLPLFERERPRWPWAQAFLISDENWALTSAEMARGGGSLAFLLGGGTVVYGTWLLSSVTGRMLGSAAGDPVRWGLDFAFTASFLALLLSMWTGRRNLLPWAVAAATAVLGQWLLPGKWFIVVGGLCGSVVGAWTGAAGDER